jgi:hypothetical protein
LALVFPAQRYSDLPNFGMGQDLLRAKARQTMLDYILLESELPRIENANNVLVPQDNSLSIYDPNFVTFIREAISNGDFDQCTHQILSEAETTICHHALQKQGIHHLLLNASYPVTVCRSPDDEIVSFRIVPEDFF